ncbi:hypothetical protein CBS101457_004857 [Exobasidium rhododendri]|nr:hypothetical protein CBS101457_004857 [Exobasidium rhododendri]
MPAIFLSLSHHILDTQAEVNGLCWINDSFRVGVTNVVKASTLIVFKLLYRIESDSQDDASNRTATLIKIRQCLRRSRETKEAHGGSGVEPAQLPKAGAGDNGGFALSHALPGDVDDQSECGQ